VKGGTSSRGETILIPHRIFESDPKYGELYDPLLERFVSQERVTRSGLSWEGGDLQLTRDPRDAFAALGRSPEREKARLPGDRSPEAGPWQRISGRLV